jgi:hypothetical protein
MAHGLPDDGTGRTTPERPLGAQEHRSCTNFVQPVNLLLMSQK